MPGTGLIRRWGVAASVCLLSLTPGAAQEAGRGEYEVRGACGCKFALYVEWPGQAGSGPIKSGLVGKDVLAGALEKTMKGRTAQGRPLEVVRFATTDDVKPCHLLFVPYGERDRLEAISRT